MKNPYVSDLAAIRKSKGITQETLSEISGVTVRTIQRMESGQVMPHMHTLKLIAKALGVSTDDIYKNEPLPAGQYNIEPKLLPLFHIIPLFGVLIPFANIIPVVVFWLIYRGDNNSYDVEGRKVINFQLTITLIACLSIPLLVLYMPLGFPLLMLCYLVGITFSILNMVRTVKKISSFYPPSIPFLAIRQNVG